MGESLSIWTPSCNGAVRVELSGLRTTSDSGALLLREVLDNSGVNMGEVKSALDVHLTSTDRGASTVQDVMARNEVSLLLSLYAYQVLHGLRCLLERQTRQGWSLSRMREQVLKTAATLSLHARRITVHLGAAADKWWPTLLKGLPKLTALS